MNALHWHWAETPSIITILIMLRGPSSIFKRVTKSLGEHPRWFLFTVYRIPGYQESCLVRSQCSCHRSDRNVLRINYNFWLQRTWQCYMLCKCSYYSWPRISFLFLTPLCLFLSHFRKFSALPTQSRRPQSLHSAVSAQQLFSSTSRLEGIYLFLPFSIAVPKLSQDHLFSKIIKRQLTRETSVAAAPTNAAINRWKVIWNCKKMQKGELGLATAEIDSAVDHECNFLNVLISFCVLIWHL